MNGPILAAVLVISVFFFLGWLIFVMWREPSRLGSYGSFLFWFLPLFYSGAWAAGSNFGTATLILFGLAAMWGIQSAKWAFNDWLHNQKSPEGLEEKIINSIERTDNDVRGH